MPEITPSLLETYRAVVKANPNSAEAHANLGWGLYGQRQYAEAIAAYEEALRLDANLVDAHYGLALAFKESGATERAVAAFETAIRLAGELENAVRGQMLAKLARGHISQMQSGNWNLGQV